MTVEELHGNMRALMDMGYAGQEVVSFCPDANMMVPVTGTVYGHTWTNGKRDDQVQLQTD